MRQRGFVHIVLMIIAVLVLAWFILFVITRPFKVYGGNFPDYKEGQTVWSISTKLLFSPALKEGDYVIYNKQQEEGHSFMARIIGLPSQSSNFNYVILGATGDLHEISKDQIEYLVWYPPKQPNKQVSPTLTQYRQDFDDLISKARQQGSVQVIVGLKIPVKPEGELPDDQAVQAQRKAIAQAQDALLSRMASYKIGSITKSKYSPWVAMDVDAVGLEYLKSDPGASTIDENRTLAETANWKTYTNTKYGFTLNYPSDWKVGELTVPVSLDKSGDSAPIVNFHAPGFPTPGVGLDGGIGFFVHMPEGDKVLADWVKDNGYKSPAAAYETIKMAGYNAVRINFVMTQERRNEILSLPGGHGGPMPVGYKAIFIYIQKGDLIFEIQAGKITNPDDFLKIVDQILSTFKFN